MRDNYIGTNTFGFYYNDVKYVQEGIVLIVYQDAGFDN
jgi:hypothetical protein